MFQFMYWLDPLSNVVSFMWAASTREVILGTDNGQLHEIAVDEKDKREKYIKFLFELKELPEAFTGLQVWTFTAPVIFSLFYLWVVFLVNNNPSFF